MHLKLLDGSLGAPNTHGRKSTATLESAPARSSVMTAPTTEFVFPPPPIPSVKIAGTEQRFPVHRIYCVGRNYAEHAREMGSDAKEPPVFFTKPADAIVASGAAIPFPTRTENLHYEVELVVAIGGAGRNIA